VGERGCGAGRWRYSTKSLVCRSDKVIFLAVDFETRFLSLQVVHHYLQTASRTMQSRLRKRGRMGKWSYIHTIRKQVKRGRMGKWSYIHTIRKQVKGDRMGKWSYIHTIRKQVKRGRMGKWPYIHTIRKQVKWDCIGM
jgi:hypothetical protein